MAESTELSEVHTDIEGKRLLRQATDDADEELNHANEDTVHRNYDVDDADHVGATFFGSSTSSVTSHRRSVMKTLCVVALAIVSICILVQRTTLLDSILPWDNYGMRTPMCMQQQIERDWEHFSHWNLSAAGPPPHIPRNVLYNAYKSVCDQDTVDVQNHLAVRSANPEWRLIFYDDDTCIRMLMALPFLKKGLFDWYLGKKLFGKNDPTVFDPGIGKFRSDVCRLGQLYVHGGVYMDNDIELQIPLDELVKDFSGDLMSVLQAGFAAKGDLFLFQAMMVAPKHSLLIKKALLVAQAIVTDERPYPHHSWFGPELMGMMLLDEFGSLKDVDPTQVHLMSETNHGMPESVRYNGPGCEFGIVKVPGGSPPPYGRTEGANNVLPPGESVLVAYSRNHAFVGTAEERKAGERPCAVNSPCGSRCFWKCSANDECKEKCFNLLQDKRTCAPQRWLPGN